MIPYARHLVEDDDIAAVVNVLRNGSLTGGGAVEEFEDQLASMVGAKHAVAFSSGTAALHAAAAATGLGSGDLVVTSPLTFVASANCARYVGAQVAFADIHEDSLNLDLGEVPRTADGLVAVHFAGRPIDLHAVRYRPRVVIEDAAHALGAATSDGPVGNCANSDVCTFSFHPAKNITTGEGGAATTNSPEIARRLRLFRNHALDRSSSAQPWRYSIDSMGFNYRLTDFQAALGSSQLRKLTGWTARRRELAAYYTAALAGSGVRCPDEVAAGWRHGWHLYVVQVEDRDRVFDEMRQAGVGVQVHYVPLNHQQTFDAGHSGHLPRCEAVCRRLLSLPLYPMLTAAQQDLVIDALLAAVG